MVTASFLVKSLMIDWRELDVELANTNAEATQD